ncbi:MAG: hypothetical protein K9J16_13510 [Melioribacteraceae bacterium]|nr:hypothetical protein [Melioribacteraceae bacterium]MCF8355437.1 hypothetical protein [Melioribacteraceae bacterium]MCF8395372.1 hypothetical protein [Melioribacteraceae bacterium]MCF8420465.1 hypothetical protein [Melioribacteraceae bacterium]
MVLAGCVNPFAPKLDESLGGDTGIITDQKTVGGVFTNFQYAYSFKDTTIYGNLLANDFSFTFRDYDLGVDVSWGRDEEMRVTNGLFSNSERLDLIWNNIISINSDSTNIVRSFNLTITFNPTDIIFVDGRVNIDLRKNEEGIWHIVNWIDQSNF